MARAARGGVLVKGGGPLENLGTLSAIAFDKTGTLTEGQPRIHAAPRDAAKIARSGHGCIAQPFAPVLGDGRCERVVAERLHRNRHAEEFILGDAIGGDHVGEATFEGKEVHIGSPKLFGEISGEPLPAALRDAVSRLEQTGRTTMVVRLGSQYLGAIGLMDTPRQAAAATLQRLRNLGITRMIMISGDNQRVADAIAKEVGLDEAWGDLMPEDKVDAINKLKAEDKVAMVGDGVNDAPAMANATVGIAMGAAGSDVALETADVALMADNLSHLPFAVGLSRQTNRVVRQNLYISLGVVTVLLPATILGLGIGPAVLAHEGSTLVVVFNAQVARLQRAFRGRPMKTLIAFDLDGTLAASKQAIDAEMASLLKALLDVATVAVMSGGDWPQFEKQLLPNLAHGTRLDRLILMPTSGTKMYQFSGQWHAVYAELFSVEERDQVLTGLAAAVASTGLDKERAWGERIEDRGSQITLSALGQQAPLEAKEAWDPDRSKRLKLKRLLDAALPGFAIGVGGSTSVDVTRAGVDKAYGIDRLTNVTGIGVEAMVFIGDALYPGGNDAPVRRTGIDALPVRDVEETKHVVQAIAACLRP